MKRDAGERDGHARRGGGGTAGHHRGGRPAAWETTPSQRRALLLAVSLLLCVGAGMGWLVARGLRTGTSVWPATKPTQQRMVQRSLEPATYWATLVIYAALGTGAVGLAVAGVVESRR